MQNDSDDAHHPPGMEENEESIANIVPESKEIDGKDASGRIKLCAEESEDMYHLYNILAEGDSVRYNP